VLAGTLGADWMKAQKALPPEEQHFVRRCFTEYARWKQRNKGNRDPDGLWSAEPDGWTQYLVSLAFDIASLIQAGELPDTLLRRLRHPDQYQGARYEVAVAAIFARLGCDVQFIADNTRRGEKHPEFMALHRTTGVEIGVEAKSRHRPGVINQAGERDGERAMRGDVRRLYNEAVQQSLADGLFMIFIDVNAPPSPDVPAFERKWAEDMKGWLSDDAPLAKPNRPRLQDR
jgi:hypothetical protein